MSKAQVPPAIRALLVHCQECGEWLPEDKTPIYGSTLLAAEQRGLVELERLDGRIKRATITAKGRAAMPGYGPAAP